MAPGETNLSTIEEGNGAASDGSSTGARIDVFIDRIHVHVKVRGRSANGPFGRFKALYRVFCTANTPSPTATSSSLSAPIGAIRESMRKIAVKKMRT
jgi:hypothetical protein